MSAPRYATALNAALHRCMAEDERVVLVGEDLADPYGGAFKVTRGLSTAFGDRVWSTPISEAAIAGLAAGAALEGLRPIAEIMFGDFLSLTFDQVLNHITKYAAMYAGQASCPVILRAATGGHRGYGPTHSQSPEKHFFGVPHLEVWAASPYHAPEAVLRHLLGRTQPALHVEHKLLYARPLALPTDGRVGDLEARGGGVDAVALSMVPPDECTVTVLAYGYAATQCAAVIERLAMEAEVFAELVVPARVAPMDWAPVLDSVARTGALVTVEEGTAGWSWGTEAAREVSAQAFGRLRRPVRVVASAPTIIPSGRDQEAEMLVSEADIARAIQETAT